MAKIKVEKHIVMAENAARFKLWLDTRGGIAVWGSVDLSNPGKTWSSPVLNKDGVKSEKPHWAATNEPIRIITDINEIEVQTHKEVSRFHIATRMGANGFAIKLTDGSSAKVRNAVKKAGEDAWYEFDYDTQEAVIYVPGSKTPLADWKMGRE